MGSLSTAAVLLLFIIQELLVCQSAPLNQFPAARSHGSDREMELVRIRRQDVAREWTVSEWSACTVSCGSGFRTRSVRCLDEDGVISIDCELNTRNASYEFCGQQDCSSGAATPNILPPNGEYEISGSDDTYTVLTFDDMGGGMYVVQQDTTEVDTTVTNFTETINPSSFQRRIAISSQTNIMFPQEDGVISFVADNNTIVSLNGLQVIPIVDNSMEVSYSDRTISIDGISFPDVDTFYYRARYRFYRFEVRKINSVSGPGTIYYDAVMGSLLYSVDPLINFEINNVINILASPSPEETDSPSTPSVDPETDGRTPSVNPETDDQTTLSPHKPRTTLAGTDAIPDDQTTVSPHKPRTTLAGTDAIPIEANTTDPDPTTSAVTEEPSISSPDTDEECDEESTKRSKMPRKKSKNSRKKKLCKPSNEKSRGKKQNDEESSSKSSSTKSEKSPKTKRLDSEKSPKSKALRNRQENEESRSEISSSTRMS